MNEYLEEEAKIWFMDHPVTAKKMLGKEDEAEGRESDNQGDDGEDGFGGSGHGNVDVSNKKCFVSKHLYIQLQWQNLVGRV